MHISDATGPERDSTDSAAELRNHWLSRHFRRQTPVLVARAPARLDVMGGIADYSGSLVLQQPLARATWAALQGRTDRRIELATSRQDRIDIFSTRMDSLLAGRYANEFELANRLHPDDRWATYPLGIIQLCAREAIEGSRPVHGMSLLLSSDIPEGEGVASSAAFEVAVMLVVAARMGLDPGAEEIATACQWVENLVVGAPCGIMDQMASLMGRKDHLLQLRCQPSDVEGQIPIPPEYRFYGISSRVRHSVSGDAYGVVRTAAFMGFRLIIDAARATPALDERLRAVDRHWDLFLCRISPETFAADFERLLPETMRGADFLALGGDHLDDMTEVQPDVIYPVRQATRHPILENARVERFAALLAGLSEHPGNAEEMGSLMYESHASYGACGLGSDATDRLVEMVRAAGPGKGLFGARVTGGGSGGTVAVFGRSDAEPLVRQIADSYHPGAEVFARSSPGAMESGVVQAG